MRHVTYYLIQPKQQLLDYFSKNQSDLKTFFTDSMLWGKNHDKGYDEYIYQLEVKILHIIEILNTAKGRLEKEYRSILKELFGTPPYTPDIFDKWWNIINCGDVLQETRPYYDMFDTKILFDIGQTGINHLDQWFESLREQSKK